MLTPYKVTYDQYELLATVEDDWDIIMKMYEYLQRYENYAGVAAAHHFLQELLQHRESRIVAKRERLVTAAEQNSR